MHKKKREPFISPACQQQPRNPARFPLVTAAQVAYGLTEEQMRRWGLYVSNPLGPEESVTPFAGGLVSSFRGCKRSWRGLDSCGCMPGQVFWLRWAADLHPEGGLSCTLRWLTTPGSPANPYACSWQSTP
jgi:hypothetical protein